MVKEKVERVASFLRRMTSGEESHKVSIIVVNWNGERFLKDCLGAALSNQSYANSEIIVVDNGSSDGSRSSRPRGTSLLPPRSTGSRVSLWISAWSASTASTCRSGWWPTGRPSRSSSSPAYDDEPTRLRVRQAGAAAYLPKPFAGATLLAAVRNAAGPA